MSGCYCGNCYTWKLHSVEAEKLLWYEEKKRGCAAYKEKKKGGRNTILYKVEALSKQRAHTIKGNAHTPTQTQTHTHKVFFFFFILYTERRWRHAPSAAGVSAPDHAEHLDAVRAPVEADARVEDQRPDVGDEEILWLVLLHILELELRELLFTWNRERGMLSGCAEDRGKRTKCVVSSINVHEVYEVTSLGLLGKIHPKTFKQKFTVQQH